MRPSEKWLKHFSILIEAEHGPNTASFLVINPEVPGKAVSARIPELVEFVNTCAPEYLAIGIQGYKRSLLENPYKTIRGESTLQVGVKGI